MSSRAGRNYLQMTVGHELSKMESYMIAGVLQIYRNFVGIMQHAQTDQLTGLANRKTFDECVARVHELIPQEDDAVANDRRESRALSYWLVMVDIDHFKSVNDRFGHLYGDEVLVILSQLMQASFRESDLIFRFGGEEFVLIIRCADYAACLVTLERFRQGVEQRSIPQVGNVTISMGVTRMERSTFAATMVDHADQALYHSKRNGRNQVSFFEDLVARGDIVIEEIHTDEISFF
jgi:diguanylate cyclase (GGDEF)-like protein